MSGLLGPMSAILDPSSALPPELGVSFKKLFKPSAVTKTKAVEEICAAFREGGQLRDEQAVDAAVSAVSQVLPRLATDPDRVVRGRTGELLGAVVAHAAARKVLGRHVRAMMPAWSLMMADPSRDVAAAAAAAFGAIPEAGRGKAVAAAKDDTFAFVRDALARAMNGLPPQGHVFEDAPSAAEAVDRTFACCAGALGATAECLAAQGDTASAAAGVSLVVPDERSWKLLFASKSAAARRAVYALVGHAVQRHPQIFDPAATAAIGPLVLGSLGDKEPSTHSAMWECVLAWLRAHADVWSLVNARKAVLPRLWAMLRASFFGSAETSCPCLLPLLSLVPPEVASGVGFFSEFFGALWHGAVHPQAGMQQSVVSAAIPALCECALHAISCTSDAEVEAFVVSPVIESAVVASLRDPLVASSARACAAVADTVGKLASMRSHPRATASLLEVVSGVASSAISGEPFVPRTPAGLLEVSVAGELSFPRLSQLLCCSCRGSAAGEECAKSVFAKAVSAAVSTGSEPHGFLAVELARAFPAVAVSTNLETVLPWLSSALSSRGPPTQLVRDVITIVLLTAAKDCKKVGSVLSSAGATGTPASFFVHALSEALRYSPECLSVGAFDEAIARFVEDGLALESPEGDQRAAVALLSVSSGVSSGGESGELPTTLAPVAKPVVSEHAMAAISAVLHERLLTVLRLPEDVPEVHALCLLDASRLVIAFARTSAAEKSGFSALLARIFSIRASGIAVLSKRADAAWSEGSGIDVGPAILEEFLSAALDPAAPEPLDHDTLVRRVRGIADRMPLDVFVSGLRKRVTPVSRAMARACAPLVSFLESRVSPPGESVVVPLQPATVSEYAKLCSVVFAILEASPALLSGNEWLATEAAVAHVVSEVEGLEAIRGRAAASVASLSGPLADLKLADRVWGNCLAQARNCGAIYALAIERLPRCSPECAAYAFRGLFTSSDSIAFQFDDDVLSVFEAVALSLMKTFFSAELLQQPGPGSLKDRLLADLAKAETVGEDVARRTLSSTRALMSLGAHTEAERATAADLAAKSMHFSRPAALFSAIAILCDAVDSGTPIQAISLAGWASAFRACHAVLSSRPMTSSTQLGCRALYLARKVCAWFWGGSSAPATLTPELVEESARFREECCRAITKLIAGFPDVPRQSFSVPMHVLSTIKAFSSVRPEEFVEPVVASEEALFCTMLRCADPVIQRCAHDVLSLGLAKAASRAEAPDDATPVSVPEEEEEEVPLPPLPAAITASLIKSLQPAGKGLPSQFGALLAWSVLHEAFAALGPAVLRSSVIAHLRESKLIGPHLAIALKLAGPNEKKKREAVLPPAECPVSAIDPGKPLSADAMRPLAAWLILQALRHFPGIVRGWWVTAGGRKECTAIEKYVAAVNRLVVSAHIGRGAASRAVLSFEKDDVLVEAAVSMSEKYPLEPATVEGLKREGGVGEALWRKWQLGLASLLAAEEDAGCPCGLVDRAAARWKEGLEKHFAGVDACPICMSVFAANGQLPTMRCRTCKNKFHSSCMVKWFSSSHQTLCPLCKTDFAVRGF